MSIVNKVALAAALTTSFASPSAFSAEAGDFLVRLGGAYVIPDDDSDCFKPGLGTCLSAGVKNDISLGITLGYMVTDNIGIGLLGAVPFNHQITAKLDGANLGTVAKAKHLPPTLTLQWHFDGMGGFRPFVGAGVNYTHFFNENTTGVLDTLDVDKVNLDDSWGAAGEIGFDIEFDDGFMFSMQAWYIQIETEAFIGDGVGTNDVDIDPWVVFAGLGKKF